MVALPVGSYLCCALIKSSHILDTPNTIITAYQRDEVGAFLASRVAYYTQLRQTRPYLNSINDTKARYYRREVCGEVIEDLFKPGARSAPSN